MRVLSPRSYFVSVVVVSFKADRHFEGQQLDRECKSFFVLKTFGLVGEVGRIHKLGLAEVSSIKQIPLKLPKSSNF
jgi:hypothetical protein